jgi:enoyl-CoA hydratase/carnithine racemase
VADIVAIKRSEPAGPVAATTERSILRLVLSNPPANALSRAVIDELQAAFEAARGDPAVRVIVIAASGKLFSAGHDLKEMTAHRNDPDRGRAFFAETMGACAALMQAIVTHPKPVIAEVDGLATAAGLQLVASCDLAIASDRAHFCTPGVNIGLFCSTPMVALSRNVSRKQAMEMLLTGETIDAKTARDFGLVNRVVPPEYLTQIVTKYAQTIASKSPLTLKIGKEAFYRQAEMSLADAYRHASEVMVENMLARDAEEGIGAFIDKRDPKWTGQ